MSPSTQTALTRWLGEALSAVELDDDALAMRARAAVSEKEAA